MENKETLNNNDPIFKNIFELAGVGIAELSIDGRFIMVNEPFARIVGYSEEELKALSYEDITYPADLETDQRYAEALLQGKTNGYSLEKRYIKKNGTIIWVNLTVSLVYDKNQKPEYFLSVIHDITDKKKAEFELNKQSKALFFSPVSIIITNKMGIIEYINPAFTKITGFTEADVIGKDPSVQASGKMDKSFYTELWRTLLKGEVWRGTFINKKKNGELYWEDAFISPVYDTQHKITHFVAVKEDITERIKAEEVILQAKYEAEKANQAKSIFIAHMSHEIRTPLNAILGFSNILIEDTSLSEEQKDKLKIINKNGEHLLNIINQILEVSKIEEGKMEIVKVSFELYSLIEDIYNTFSLKAEEKNICLSFYIEEDVPSFIMSDETKLRQILINLIGNAVKFTCEGSVMVRVSSMKRENQQFLRFSVQDTGVGIEKDSLETIFENFVQVGDAQQSEGGTGLGLAITKQMIRNIGGDISVKSMLGEGSDFTFYIPVEITKKESVEGKSERDIVFESNKEKLPVTVLSAFVLDETKKRLKTAVEEGDVDEINGIIDEISQINYKDSEMLRVLSNAFEFDKLLKILN